MVGHGSQELAFGAVPVVSFIVAIVALLIAMSSLAYTRCRAIAVERATAKLPGSAICLGAMEVGPGGSPVRV